jgi:ubiquinone/menaquinone biosynthesis C-methylase UbiE
MNQKNLRKGSVESFESNWKNQEEALYTHWTRADVPKNQIQLAFREHYRLFKKLIFEQKEHYKTLEVGCGRGSLSSYFADNGSDCTLVDISENVIQVAKNIFEESNLKADFVVADAKELPFKDGEFDLVFSIGLLEHFEEIDSIINDQIRVLKKGGTFIGYVVPENLENIQKDFEWINKILKSNASKEEFTRTQNKVEVFRSDENSERYIKSCKASGLTSVQSAGTYPLPMISHSKDFPFTLMNPESETILVDYFLNILKERDEKYERDRWLCDEEYGQAFLVWGKKK